MVTVRKPILRNLKRKEHGYLLQLCYAAIELSILNLMYLLLDKEQRYVGTISSSESWNIIMGKCC